MHNARCQAGESILNTPNAFGDMATYTALDGATVLYSTDQIQDNIGRIMQKVETIQGIATTYDYVYDLAGHLEEVVINRASDQL